jgi:Reverse transcriptase (RNA-dependent DNA polymerase)
VVGCKWLFKIKKRYDGAIECYKIILVAKRYTQQDGLNYVDTFSPVIKPTTVRIVLS